VFEGIPTPRAFFDLARKLTVGLVKIHQRFVIHGDICPENVLVTPAGDPVLIDFGQAAMADAMNVFDQVRNHPYRAPESSRTEGGDLYSLGGLLFFAATGLKPVGIGRTEDNETLKLQVGLKIQEANPALYRDNGGVVDVISRCLRLRGRIEHATHLLRDLDTFAADTDIPAVVDAVSSLESLAKELDATGNALFRWIASDRTAELCSAFHAMAQGAFSLSGDTEDLRGAASRLLRALGPGDEYLSISVPRFWWPENIGINGRFLTMNRNAAALGARVRRVFLIGDDDLNDPYLKQIVAAQLQVAKDLGYSDRYWVRFTPTTPEVREQMLRAGRHFGLLVKGGDHIAMYPSYGASGRLTKLRFLAKRDAQHLRDAFDQLALSSNPLVDLKLKAIDVARA
jgi:hypothetical protein